MNRLLFSKAYMVGSMDRSWEAGKEWREWLEQKLIDMGIIPMNPYKKSIIECNAFEDDDSFEKRSRAKKAGDWDTFAAIMKPVRAVDLRMVDRSDFLICNYTINIHLCGTIEEIVTANRQKKPVLIMCEEGKYNIPDWLFGMLPHELFFESWDDLLEYLRHINEDEEISNLGRWTFFNDIEIIKGILKHERTV